MCDGHHHNLKVIYCNGYDHDVVDVVRWCEDCGAVVVDGDYDGRTRPGAVMKMRFPKTATRLEDGGCDRTTI